MFRIGLTVATVFAVLICLPGCERKIVSRESHFVDLHVVKILRIIDLHSGKRSNWVEFRELPQRQYRVDAELKPEAGDVLRCEINLQTMRKIEPGEEIMCAEDSPGLVLTVAGIEAQDYSDGITTQKSYTATFKEAPQLRVGLNFYNFNSGDKVACEIVLHSAIVEHAKRPEPPRVEPQIISI